jgi:hypothetical protein
MRKLVIGVLLALCLLPAFGWCAEKADPVNPVSFSLFVFSYQLRAIGFFSLQPFPTSQKSKCNA